ncbi:glycosyltransferase family 4 protein [uncultured Thiodictyon sp.]|uniref:glycosyltransferase family 4 protein n=1 Tax=uncultured Thiodictyon sp. TaxID=1846217 RepID=UPI0025F42CF0|nr:glycosyltransferase family 4 protein [uncultured Thiodictyon sp.]
MRVLFVLHSHSYGGAEMHLSELARGLAARGHELAFAGPADSWLARRFRAAGFAGYHLPMHGFFDAWSMVKLARIARRFGADLIHGHLTRGAFYAGIGGRLTGLPVVATAHSTNAGKHFGRANRIIAVSQAVADFLVGEGYDPARVTVVHHGVADPLLVPLRPTLRASLTVPMGAVLCGIVARLVRAKGHDLAIDALADCPERIQLVLIGDDSTPWGRAMRARAAACGLAERVHFLGFREAAPQWMRELDMVLAPSRREALSLTLAEAAAVGLPVVAACVGGIPEVVVDGETGLLVPPEDAAALGAAMRRLADDPALRARLGTQGRARYLHQFSLETMTAGTEAVYRQLT